MALEQHSPGSTGAPDSGSFCSPLPSPSRALNPSWEAMGRLTMRDPTSPMPAGTPLAARPAAGSLRVAGSARSAAALLHTTGAHASAVEPVMDNR